jgi:hypothetical protein
MGVEKKLEFFFYSHLKPSREKEELDKLHKFDLKPVRLTHNRTKFQMKRDKNVHAVRQHAQNNGALLR